MKGSETCMRRIDGANHDASINSLASTFSQEFMEWIFFDFYMNAELPISTKHPLALDFGWGLG